MTAALGTVASVALLVYLVWATTPPWCSGPEPTPHPPADPTVRALRRLQWTIIGIVAALLVVVVTVLAVQAHRRAEHKRWVEEHCVFNGYAGIFIPGCP